MMGLYKYNSPCVLYEMPIYKPFYYIYMAESIFKIDGQSIN